MGELPLVLWLGSSTLPAPIEEPFASATSTRSRESVLDTGSGDADSSVSGAAVVTGGAAGDPRLVGQHVLSSGSHYAAADGRETSAEGPRCSR